MKDPLLGNNKFERFAGMDILRLLLWKINEYPCTSGIIIGICAFIIHHIIKRRRFYRRNAQGLQTFPSYSRSVVVPFIESIINLISMVLMLVGVALFFMGLSK